MFTYTDPDAHVAEAGDGFFRLRRATPAECRANRLSRLRERQRVLSDELEKVSRELNAMGANDGV